MHSRPLRKRLEKKPGHKWKNRGSIGHRLPKRTEGLTQQHIRETTSSESCTILSVSAKELTGEKMRIFPLTGNTVKSPGSVPYHICPAVEGFGLKKKQCLLWSNGPSRA